MSPSNSFIITFFFLLVISQWFSMSFKNSSNYIFIPIIYVTTLSICFRITAQMNFWIRKNNQKKNNLVSKMWGVELSDDNSKDNETHLIANLSLILRARRFSASIICSILLMFVSPYLFQNPFSITSALLSINTLWIINSSYVGHFLLLGTINSAFFFVNKQMEAKSSHVEFIIIALITILLFVSYYAIEISSQGGKHKYNWRDIYLHKTLRIALGIGGIYLLLTLALPDKLILFDKKRASHKIATLTQNVPQKSTFNLSVDFKSDYLLKQNFKLDIDFINQQLLQSLNQIQQIQKVLDSMPHMNPELKINVQNLEQDVNHALTDLQKLRKKSSVDPREAERFAEELSTLSEQLSGTIDQFERSHNSINESLKKFPSKNYKELSKNIEQTKLADKFNELQSIFDKIEIKNNEMTPKITEALKKHNERESKQKQQLALKKNIEKKKQKLNEIINLLQKVTVTFLITVGLYFISLFFKKKDEKILDVLDQEEVKHLLRELKKTRKRKLSPNEEIIISYNIFKDAIQKTKFSHAEVPPPEVLFHSLYGQRKKLKPHSWTVTDLFCDCYYGHKMASVNELKVFRKSFNYLIKSQV